MEQTFFSGKRIIVKAIKEIKEEYGCITLRNSERFKALLHDYLPDFEKERRVLNLVIEEGIAEQLLRVKGEKSADIKNAFDVSVNRLIDESGLAKEIYEEAISICAEGFGIQINFEKDIKNNETRKTEEINHKKVFTYARSTADRGKQKEVSPPDSFYNYIYMGGNHYYTLSDFRGYIAKYIKEIEGKEDQVFEIKYMSQRLRDNICFIKTYMNHNSDDLCYTVVIGVRDVNYHLIAKYEDVLHIFQTVCVNLSSPDFSDNRWTKTDIHG